MATRFWVGGSATWDASNTTNWSATSGGAGGQTVPTSADTVTFDGNSGAAAVITVNASVAASSVALGVTGGNFTGTLDFATNNNSPTFGTFAFSGSGTRTLNLGSGTWTLNGIGTPWDMTTTTGLTLNASTSTLNFTGISNGRTMAWGASQSYATVNITGSSSGFSVAFAAGAATFANLGLTGPCALVLQSGNTYTVSNQFTWAGTAASPLSIQSSSAGSAATIGAGAAGSTIAFAALRLITFTTNAVSATNSFDLKGNTMNGGSITAPSGGGGARMISG